MKHRLTILVTAAVALSTGAAVMPQGAGAATAGGGDNVVIVQNRVDNNAVARDSLRVDYDPADVANQNVAIAESSSCTGCRTVSVAMQVVLEESNAQTVAPSNAASAVNGGCNFCTTFAFAYQYLLTPYQVVYLSAGTQQQIANIDRQVNAVAASDLSYSDMTAQLDALFAQLVSTVNQNLHAAGIPATGTTVESHQAA
jgi:hypothetical protein